METRGSSFLPMGFFDRFTSKATDNVIASAKETLNDKLEAYSGIIKIGLTIGVIAFGSKKINDHRQAAYSQPPVIINNYYDGGRGYYGQRQNFQEHKKRR